MTYQRPTPRTANRDVDRRTLFRRGGVVVAATAAGLTAAEAINAGNAQAAAGDSVVLGHSNDAGSVLTTVTSSASGGTLALANTGVDGPLALVAQPASTFVPTAAGILANVEGTLAYTYDFGGGKISAGFVYTEYSASQLIPITPQRVLDTRSAAGRVKVISPPANFDSAGRLIAGHTVVIDLRGLEVAAAAASCNLTAVQPVSAGYMTLFAGAVKPATSSLNFATGAVIANFAITGVSETDTVSIYTNTTSHVLLDITAFHVGSPSQINPDFLPAAGKGTTNDRLSARAKANRLPSWYRDAVTH